MRSWQASNSPESSYRKDNKEAIRDATPQTITVALVRFDPVPFPDAPPGMSKSRVRGKLASKLSGRSKVTVGRASIQPDKKPYLTRRKCWSFYNGRTEHTIRIVLAGRHLGTRQSQPFGPLRKVSANWEVHVYSKPLKYSCFFTCSKDVVGIGKESDCSLKSARPWARSYPTDKASKDESRS